MKRVKFTLLATLLIAAVILAVFMTDRSSSKLEIELNPTDVSYSIENNNKPYFTEADLARGSDPFEEYSVLDSLGRCGVAYANICSELMPTEKRSEIGMIKPSGWHTVRYDDLVDGKYLYNRCHLIGFQLAGENANEQNLITGTRYLNVQGMLPFENQVANYVKETGNHVLYRVTPDFHGTDLVAHGVMIEAQSVEDDAISFCVYCHNVQPGIVIDYATGESCRADADIVPSQTPAEISYILNVNSMKFHRPDCSSVSDISHNNKRESDLTREQLIKQGYKPCGSCKP